MQQAYIYLEAVVSYRFYDWINFQSFLDLGWLEVICNVLYLYYFIEWPTMTLFLLESYLQFFRVAMYKLLTFLGIDNWETGTKTHYRKKSTTYKQPSVAAVTTMMKPKAADSAAPQVITTYFSLKMPPKMSNNQGMKKSPSRNGWKTIKNDTTTNQYNGAMA